MERTSTQEMLAVLSFNKPMLHKLEQRRDKGHWENVDVQVLLDLLIHEVKELVRAIENEGNEAIILECADVANYAMFIADNCKKLGVKR